MSTITSGNVTGAEAGLSGEAQIKVALEAIAARGGTATTLELYDALESRLNGRHLSLQGKSSLRFYVNKVAVKAGYLRPFDRESPGWHITPEGRGYLESLAAPVITEEVINLDTQQPEQKPVNTVRGTAFELYVLKLLKVMYPHYAWYHQGIHKYNERGLDFLGDRIGDSAGAPVIGVQVKFHAPNNALPQLEWLKFLAGCFARRLDVAIFITTGRMTGEQRREAAEAKVKVIESRDEVIRIATLHGIETFELFNEDATPSEVELG
jgi:hypothetical protein